jgi:hypothetical protein
MSLQAIAGVAYDRRHPDRPSPVAARQTLDATDQTGTKPTAEQAAAKQLNGALESLKRYVPTEFLALYLPFLAIAKDRGANAPDISRELYVGFIIATPFVVYLIYIAKAVEAGTPRAWRSPPVFEALLATIAFAIWGASVPGMFVGQQWWLGMLAMAASVLLPLVDTALGKKAR